MKNSFLIIFLFAFSFKSVFSQGREIKEVFSASTQSFEVGDSCFIPALFWLSGGGYLTTETIWVCDSIYAFLKKHPSVSIAIIAHSDPRPILMGNDMLTARRAKIIKEKMLEYGDIDSNRIIAIGMADNQPRVVTEEIHQQYNFLPVGQILDMEFCRTIPDFKNREIAYGLNHITVVKIIEK
jgi:hypothetical protein